MAILSLKNLVKAYNKRQVVKSVSMKIANSSVVGLLGPNGAGKTTTFYMIIGMIKPDEGQVFLDDEDVTSYPMYLRARKGVGYLPQETSIFRKLTVMQNIMAILETLRISKSDQKERANSLLDELGKNTRQTKRQICFPAGNGDALKLHAHWSQIHHLFFLMNLLQV